jgi:hypothetical protein
MTKPEIVPFGTGQCRRHQASGTLPMLRGNGVREPRLPSNVNLSSLQHACLIQLHQARDLVSRCLPANADSANTCRLFGLTRGGASPSPNYLSEIATLIFKLCGNIAMRKGYDATTVLCECSEKFTTTDQIQIASKRIAKSCNGFCDRRFCTRHGR